MQSKEEKYNGAVMRNFTGFKSRFSGGEINLAQLAKETLASLKTRIGIRNRDTAQDIDLSFMLAEAVKKTEAGTKKADRAEKATTELVVAEKPVKKSRFDRPGVAVH